MENKNISSLKLFSKDNQINIITSFPKSGSTWLRFIIYDLFFNKDNVGISSSQNIKHKIPDFHNIKKIDNQVFEKFLKSKQIFFKTHFSYSQMKMLPIDKVIIIIRNPFDIFISLFNFYEIDENKKDTLLDYFCLHKTLPFLEKFKFPNWKDHFESWITSRKNFHIIKYSELIDNFEKEIKYLSNFLNLKVTDEKINFIKNNTEFNNLKRLEIDERKKNLDGFFIDAMKGKKSQFINKGGNKNYQNFFTDTQLSKLKESFSKELDKYKI